MLSCELFELIQQAVIKLYMFYFYIRVMSERWRNDSHLLLGHLDIGKCSDKIFMFSTVHYILYIFTIALTEHDMLTFYHETMGIPYTGQRVHCSACCINRNFCINMLTKAKYMRQLLGTFTELIYVHAATLINDSINRKTCFLTKVLLLSPQHIV